jgi:hypothetical protein
MAMMSNQRQPVPDAASSSGSELSPQQGAKLWIEMLNAGFKLVWAGMRKEADRTGETIDVCYRRWYEQQMNQHDRTVEQMMRRMKQR